MTITHLLVYTRHNVVDSDDNADDKKEVQSNTALLPLQKKLNDRRNVQTRLRVEMFSAKFIKTGTSAAHCLSCLQPRLKDGNVIVVNLR